MPVDLSRALAELRLLILDPDRFVRAVAAGRRRGHELAWRRAELRPVDLKTGRHLQIVTYDERAARTRNETYDVAAAAAVDDLLGQPFGNWHVETTSETLQLRVTKKGAAQLHRASTAARSTSVEDDTSGHRRQETAHDRSRQHLIDPGDPLFTVLGANAAKRRQVDAFLRMLSSAVEEAGLPEDRPVRVVDLGCGNAYLTFAAYRFLTSGAAVNQGADLVGVDLRPEMRERNGRIASRLGWQDDVRFVAGSILDAPVDDADIVLALHACDTATDDALAQAVRWRARVLLAAPCCHHDIQRQLKSARAPSGYAMVTRHAILRERWGDVLTDALRAALLRRAGYRVEVQQFVDAEYTPRNTMLKAVRTEAGSDAQNGDEYDELVRAWGVTPYLQRLLAGDEV